MNDILTAICLIAGEPGTPEPVPSEADFYALRENVHKVAISWEILDPRETYIFAKPSDFQVDLDLLRRRNVELRDAPRLCEAEKLPPREWSSALCTFNREYKQRLENRRELEKDREHYFDAAICEADCLYRLWDSVRDGKAEFYYITVRRHALMRLRDQLGPEDWAAVRLPPPVPVWRME